MYLTVRMEQPIRPLAKLGENVKNIKTPVQIALPNPLEIDGALLLVKKGNQQRIQSMVCELGLDKQITVAEFDDVFDTLSQKRLD